MGCVWLWIMVVVAMPCAVFVPQQMAHAQTPAAPPTSVVAPVPVQPDDTLPLLHSTSLQEWVSPGVRHLLPTFISGDHIAGQSDLTTVVQGHAMLRRGDTVIIADQQEYDRQTDLARALGHVRIQRAGNVYTGPLLELRVDTFEGFFDQPSYVFLKNNAHGQADRVDFQGDQHTVIHHASYTTCQRQPGPNWLPDWILNTDTLTIDNAQDTGVAQGALLSFKGLPLLPVPYLSFPLSDRRKSGFLPPTVGLDNDNGLEVTSPYYWNLAPNRDTTFTPTLMTKRGVNLATTLRYLEADHSGNVQLDWMPDDSLRQSDRWGIALDARADLASPWADHGTRFDLHINRVGDDNYWRDFTHTQASQTQRLLANDARFDWTAGSVTSTVRLLKWQTLQDITAPITPPYDRLPQVSTRYVRTAVYGFDYAATADFTRFQADAVRTGQPNGQRMLGLMQVAYPVTAPFGFIKPQWQWHATSYQLETPLANGDTSAVRTLPTFSLDSGLVLERDTSLFGHALRQTLEPRAFYVRTPYRDQRWLPNYDSGANDFNLSTIYSGNAFVGNDRISDSNLLTLGVTTRWLSPDTGAEAARLGLAQRLRFTEQSVTLPGGAPAYDRISDLLLGGLVNWNPQWSFGGTVQFNPTTEQSVRSTLEAHYNPGSYRSLTAAYRYQRDSSEQIDLGWQWPLSDWGRRAVQNFGPGVQRWYSVGRLNFSMNESKLVDSILGFEYDAGCWLARIVLERLQTSTEKASQRVMFQLELTGFVRLGVSPLKSLKDNIPNYQYLHDPASVPSRFNNYL